MYKRISLLILVVMMNVAISYAQEEVSNEKAKAKHELKVNMAYALFEIVELNYELVVDNDFSVGLAGNYWFGSQRKMSYQIIPYFRFYPIESMHGYGFFIEANASFMTLNDYYYSDVIQREIQESRFGGGMGIAAGYKFLSKDGFVMEAYTGLGRVFGDDNIEFYPRLGITMGKRF